MKRLALVIALAAVGSASLAADLKRYETRLDVAADGNGRASAVVDISKASAGRLKLPTGFAALPDFTPGEAPAGVTMAPRSADGTAWVELTLPEGVPAEFTLRFGFATPGALAAPKPEKDQKPTLPEGSRVLRHTFVNTQDASIGRYALVVRLPAGEIVHRIQEQSPAVKRKEFAPRVELDRLDGLQSATLQLSGLRQGDRTAMAIEVVPAQRSPAWALMLLPLALAWLWQFKDLARSSAAAAKGESAA